MGEGFILPLIHYKDEKDGEELVVYFGNVDRLSSFLVQGLCLSDDDTLKIGGGYFSLPFNGHRTRFGLLGKYLRLDDECRVTQSLSTFMPLQGDGSKIEKVMTKVLLTVTHPLWMLLNCRTFVLSTCFIVSCFSLDEVFAGNKLCYVAKHFHFNISFFAVCLPQILGKVDFYFDVGVNPFERYVTSIINTQMTSVYRIFHCNVYHSHCLMKYDAKSILEAIGCACFSTGYNEIIGIIDDEQDLDLANETCSFKSGSFILVLQFRRFPLPGLYFYLFCVPKLFRFFLHCVEKSSLDDFDNVQGFFDTGFADDDDEEFGRDFSCRHYPKPTTTKSLHCLLSLQESCVLFQFISLYSSLARTASGCFGVAAV